jgi:hypothetical protein
MKKRKLIFLTAVLLMTIMISSTITTDAYRGKGKGKAKKVKVTVVTFTFDAMEFQNAPPDPARREWVDRHDILHIIGGAYYFYVAHEFFGPNSLVATTRRLKIDTTTGNGRGVGRNYFTGVSFIPGFEGMDFEMGGFSRLYVENWYISGWARSRGTIGEYKIRMSSEFGPVFENGIFVGTYLRGTISIYIK